MNLNSEIQFFMDLRPVDKARLLNLFLHELAEEARATYGPAEQVHDGVHLRFVNELYHRLTRVIDQVLAEDPDRLYVLLGELGGARDGVLVTPQQFAHRRAPARFTEQPVPLVT